jgi:hypothetical protein
MVILDIAVQMMAPIFQFNAMDPLSTLIIVGSFLIILIYPLNLIVISMLNAQSVLVLSSTPSSIFTKVPIKQPFNYIVGMRSQDTFLAGTYQRAKVYGASSISPFILWSLMSFDCLYTFPVITWSLTMLRKISTQSLNVQEMNKQNLLHSSKPALMVDQLVKLFLFSIHQPY